MAQAQLGRRATRRVLTSTSAVAVAAVLVAALAAEPVRATAVASSRRLSANLLASVDARPSQAVGPATPMTVGVALSRPDPAGEMALSQSLYRPGSPDYRHFLSPAAFNARFGVTATTFARAAGWLRAGGLAVDTSSGSRDYLLATGTAEQIDRVFATTIRRYGVGSDSFLANATAPSVPGDLPILSVVGLNTYQRFAIGAHAAEPRRAGGPHTTVPNLFTTTPQDLWSIYQQPAAYQGGGQTVAVFGAGTSAGTVTDLAQFEREHDLPAVPVTVHNVGPGPFTDTSGAGEWDIDTQASTGMAPEVSGLTLYFGAALVDAVVEQMFATWANDPNGAAQASASFAECERTPLDPILEQLPGDISQNALAPVGLELGNNLEPVAEQTLRQATMEGRTLFAATGDNGSSCPVVSLPGIGTGNGLLNQVVPLTAYPASSPYAVAVGGTVLYTTGTTPDARLAEYAWTFSGGGDSLLINAPAYQRGTPGLLLPCLATVDGQLTNLGQPCRGVPDVAAQSGDVLTNGYGIVASGVDAEGGGTSLSSPLLAGMRARINQSALGGGYGFANETIYRLGKNPATRVRDFHDITVGANGLYGAHPGWDYVSGFGTPNVASIIADARS